jgi:hypothetical protein
MVLIAVKLTGQSSINPHNGILVIETMQERILNWGMMHAQLPRSQICIVRSFCTHWHIGSDRLRPEHIESESIKPFSFRRLILVCPAPYCLYDGSWSASCNRDSISCLFPDFRYSWCYYCAHNYRWKIASLPTSLSYRQYNNKQSLMSVFASFFDFFPFSFCLFLHACAVPDSSGWDFIFLTRNSIISVSASSQWRFLPQRICHWSGIISVVFECRRLTLGHKYVHMKWILFGNIAFSLSSLPWGSDICGADINFFVDLDRYHGFLVWYQSTFG